MLTLEGFNKSGRQAGHIAPQLGSTSMNREWCWAVSPTPLTLHNRLLCQRFNNFLKTANSVTSQELVFTDMSLKTASPKR